MYNRNGTYIYFHISVSEVHVMNLQQLRYAVEVAKTGSITQPKICIWASPT